MCESLQFIAHPLLLRKKRIVCDCRSKQLTNHIHRHMFSSGQWTELIVAGSTDFEKSTNQSWDENTWRI